MGRKGQAALRYSAKRSRKSGEIFPSTTLNPPTPDTLSTREQTQTQATSTAPEIVLPILIERPLTTKSVYLCGPLQNKEHLAEKVKELGGFLTNKPTEHTIVVSTIEFLTKNNPSKATKKLLKSSVSQQSS